MGKKKQYKVLGINTNLWTKGNNWFDEFDFDPYISFSDYDAVIINTKNLLYNYESADNSPYLNKDLLSVYASHKIVEDFKQIKAQIIDYTKQGKLVFVIVGKNEKCYILLGDSEYSNKKEFDTNSFLPFSICIQYLIGEKFVRSDTNDYKEFFDNTGNSIMYSAQFTLKNSVPLLMVPNSDKVISAEIPYENGRIILLPSIFDDYENEKDFEKSKKLYLDELHKLIEKLYQSDIEFTLPDWTNSFQILDENKQQEKLQSDLAKLQKLQNKIEKEKTKLEAIQKYKALLTETGAALENIIKQVLSEIGFTLQPTEIGRSDIIAKYKNIIIVVEVKGVTKTAAEKHAAQLEKWVAQFMEENEFHPKPLLIVNAFKDTPLSERTEEVFPEQMLKYSEAREHALISTTQLLCLYIDIKTNPEKKDEVIDELLSTIGVYNKYTNITDYIIPVT